MHTVETPGGAAFSAQTTITATSSTTTTAIGAPPATPAEQPSAARIIGPGIRGTPPSGVLRTEAGAAAAAAGYHFSVVDGVLPARPSAVPRIETGGEGRAAVVARPSEAPRTELVVQEVLRLEALRIGVEAVAGAGPVGGEEVAPLSAGRIIGVGGNRVGLGGRQTGRWTGLMVIMCCFVADVFLPACPSTVVRLVSFAHARIHDTHFFIAVRLLYRALLGVSLSSAYVLCSDFLF